MCQQRNGVLCLVSEHFESRGWYFFKSIWNHRGTFKKVLPNAQTINPSTVLAFYQNKYITSNRFQDPVPGCGTKFSIILVHVILTAVDATHSPAKWWAWLCHRTSLWHSQATRPWIISSGSIGPLKQRWLFVQIFSRVKDLFACASALFLLLRPLLRPLVQHAAPFATSSSPILRLILAQSLRSVSHKPDARTPALTSARLWKWFLVDPGERLCALLHLAAQEWTPCPNLLGQIGAFWRLH